MKHCYNIKVKFAQVSFHKSQACYFIKKETLAQLFSCEFCEIFKTTFSTEHLRTAASPWKLNDAVILVLLCIIEKFFVYVVQNGDVCHEWYHKSSLIVETKLWWYVSTSVCFSWKWNLTETFFFLFLLLFLLFNWTRHSFSM